MRRGQLLSLDAMLSMVIIILLLGTITTTSNALKGEITTVLGWYERANVGDNMLDILVKNPGTPDNWQESPSTLGFIGLENSQYPTTIDYAKIEALNNAVAADDQRVRTALGNISDGKDFTLGFYLTRVEIEGNVTVIPPQVEGSVDIPSGGHLSVTPRTGYAYGNGLHVEWINPARSDSNGVGNIQHIINVTAGESFVFKLAEDGSVRLDLVGPGNQGGPVNYDIPSGAVVHIDVETGYLLIGWNQLNDGTYALWIPYHRNNQQIWTTWTGTVWWGQGGSVSSTNLTIKYVYATKVVNADYNITMINGSFVTDPPVITASRNNSPWVTYTERRIPMTKRIYNSSYVVTPSSLPAELYVGTIYTPIPDYMTLKVAFNDTGYLVMVAWMRGTNISGYSVLAAYKTSTNPEIRAIINQTINGNSYIKSYSSDNPYYVIIPWKEFLTQIQPGESLDIYVWVYEMDNINTAIIADLNGMDTIMKPQASLAVLKLWVWDDS
ncbi:hypothetical protein [Thermococcus sp. 5-4]|uniref:hypothetical protein n=1 Tax=Thermococcus sp. 5-4 TaxID=2008440 RepID=UPI000B49BDF6|nr:hypothetical protein [Thermococcus sp. 5-4]ASA76785.1 hypothetical protein CDI07_00210 [Thermococcus sp. 5-4]